MKRTRPKDPAPARGGGLVYRGGLVSKGGVRRRGGRRTTSRRRGERDIRRRGGRRTTRRRRSERVVGDLRDPHLRGRSWEPVSAPQQGTREGAGRKEGQQARGRLKRHRHDSSPHEGEKAEEEGGERGDDHGGNGE